jgi:tRNA(Ile)-lysidine synthase
VTQSLEHAMRAFEPALPLGVAYSGGADSTALLLACARKWPGRVVALHVNHGLQEAAKTFEQHCRAVCDRWGLPLNVVTVNAHAEPGQSPEDAARISRYEALDAMARADYGAGALQSIALAQHADDQVETLLLALSRGAGVAGLSGMPSHWTRGSLNFHRPFLDVSRQTLLNWLASEGEGFVEDPTNSDIRFTRNHIRARLLPAIELVFPKFRDTFARSARHAAQAQLLLDELAAADLQSMMHSVSGLPLLKSLRALRAERRVNVLRHWLKNSFGVIPTEAQLRELCGQIEACTTRGHRIAIKVGNGFVERRGPVLAWYNSALFPSGKQFIK